MYECGRNVLVRAVRIHVRAFVAVITLCGVPDAVYIGIYVPKGHMYAMCVLCVSECERVCVCECVSVDAFTHSVRTRSNS